LRPRVPAVDPAEHEAALRNRRFFDGYWQRGRHERDKVWRAWWRDAYDQLFEFAGPLASKQAVFLFTGLGEDANMLATRGAKVFAIDFALAGLRQAAKEAPSANNPKMLCGDATSLPLATASVDLAFVVNGLCHTPKALVLAECRRVLKPDGKVLLLEVMRYPHLAMLARWLEPYRWRAPHRHVSVGEIEDLAKAFSFARHREFYLLSVLSAMLLRLPAGVKLFWPLHQLMIAADRPLLRWFPWLRRISYVCVAEFRP
jgi:SAM-dependent methyltransferase